MTARMRLPHPASILAAVGYNFRLILNWIQALWLRFLNTLISAIHSQKLQIPA